MNVLWTAFFQAITIDFEGGWVARYRAKYWFFIVISSRMRNVLKKNPSSLEISLKFTNFPLGWIALHSLNTGHIFQRKHLFGNKNAETKILWEQKCRKIEKWKFHKNFIRFNSDFDMPLYTLFTLDFFTGFGAILFVSQIEKKRIHP